MANNQGPDSEHIQKVLCMEKVKDLGSGRRSDFTKSKKEKKSRRTQGRQSLLRKWICPSVTGKALYITQWMTTPYQNTSTFPTFVHCEYIKFWDVEEIIMSVFIYFIHWVTHILNHIFYKVIFQNMSVSFSYSTFCETTPVFCSPLELLGDSSNRFLKKLISQEQEKQKALRIPIPYLPSKRSQGNKFSDSALIVGGNGDLLNHSLEVWGWGNTEGTPEALTTKGWEKQMVLGLTCDTGYRQRI